MLVMVIQETLPFLRSSQPSGKTHVYVFLLCCNRCNSKSLNQSVINVQEGISFYAGFQEGFMVTFKLRIQESAGLL